MRRLKRSFVEARNPRLLAASAATGVIVAVVIAAFETVTLKLILEPLLEQNLVVLILAPAAGLVMAKLVLRTVGRGVSGATSDEYIRAFHERHPRLPLRYLPAKLIAGVATIGGGGALGLEGPSMYAGSTLGLFLHRRLGRVFRRDEARVLLTAGAAAGVAAVFKAPATGVIFAIEAPYRDDVTPQALLPSLIASASSYTTFVLLVGSNPVVPFLGEGRVSPEGAASALNVHLADLFGAVVLGVAAGLGGRGFAWLVRRAKNAAQTISWPRRVIVASLVLAGLTVLTDWVFDEVLSLGSGTEAMQWVVEQSALEMIALLFGVRMVAILAAVVGGGVGGLFIPLATLGVILGQFVGVALDTDVPGLYPTLGLAAFLGAGYRAPIATVMFVAESTGAVGAFVVPALVAAAVSQVVGGPSSVAGYQLSKRLGHLEKRFTMPLNSIVTTDVLTVPPDASVSEFFYLHVLGRRELSVPVVADGVYLGMAELSELSAVDREAWETTTVESMMTTLVPTGSLSWTLRNAMVAMEAADVDVLAVVDDAGKFIGIVTDDDVVRLGEILEETDG